MNNELHLKCRGETQTEDQTRLLNSKASTFRERKNQEKKLKKAAENVR